MGTPHTVKLVQGVSEYQLNSGGSLLLSWDMNVANVSVQELRPNSLNSGGIVSKLARHNVEEVLTIMISESSAVFVQDKVNLFEKRLEQANRRREIPSIEPVYLVVQMGSDTVEWRSEILRAEMDPTIETPNLLHDNKAMFELRIRRNFYWEGPEEQVLLGNYSLSPSLTEKQISNKLGGVDGGGNFVYTQGIDGVLPTPLRIKIRNDNGASIWWRRFWIGHGIGDYATDYANFALQGGTGTVDSGSSAGSYQTSSWVGAVADSIRYTLTVPKALLNRSKGDYWRLILRDPNRTAPDPDVWVKWKLIYSTTWTLMESEYVLQDEGLQDLGVIQLPPNLEGVDDFPDLTLRLQVRADVSESLDVDFLYFMPMHSYRVLETSGGNFPNGDSIVDDGMAGHVYYEEAANGQKITLFQGQGDPVHVWPGQANWLFFLMEDSLVTWNKGLTAGITAWYRQRRLSI